MRSRGRVPSLTFIFTVSVLASIASGCRERVWDFGVELIPPDGGVPAAPRVYSSRDVVKIDLTGAAGTGGSVGGSGGGGSGGTAGTGGTVPMWDPALPGRRGDISNARTWL